MGAVQYGPLPFLAVSVFQKWVPQNILPTNAFGDMQIIYEVFAGSVIREGFGKILSIDPPSMPWDLSYNREPALRSPPKGHRGTQ